MGAGASLLQDELTRDEAKALVPESKWDDAWDANFAEGKRVSRELAERVWNENDPQMRGGVDAHFVGCVALGALFSRAPPGFVGARAFGMRRITTPGCSTPTSGTCVCGPTSGIHDTPATYPRGSCRSASRVLGVLGSFRETFCGIDPTRSLPTKS